MSEKTILAKGRYLSLVEKDHYEFAERIRGNGVAVILPITDDGKVILVEQHRMAVGRRAIELPAGLANDETKDGEKLESLEQTAHRELIEETGYQAEKMKFLGDFPTSSGMSSEAVSLYLATGLKKVAAGGGDASEQISIHEVPYKGMTDWLFEKRRQGFALDYKIFAAAFLYEQLS